MVVIVRGEEVMTKIQVSLDAEENLYDFKISFNFKKHLILKRVRLTSK